MGAGAASLFSAALTAPPTSMVRPAEQLGTPDVAEAVHLSVRALQAGFRAHLGCTPMAYLRRMRLERVRESLTDGSAASVTDAALRWGVPHLGRLAGDYRAAFDESPSETLRRR